MTEPTSPDAAARREAELGKGIRDLLRVSFRSTRRRPLDDRERDLQASAFNFLSGMTRAGADGDDLRVALLAAMDEIDQLVSVERRIEDAGTGA